MALSAIGSDRPGIVSRVSRALFEHGCNIEDSSMTILRGEFAMILVVSAPQNDQALANELDQIAADLGLVLSFRPLPESGAQPAGEAGSPFIVSVYGADKPGIVHQVTQALADNQVNITDVNTRMVGAGSPVYIMILEVEVPDSLTEPAFRASLETLGKELSVDITVRPLETANL